MFFKRPTLKILFEEVYKKWVLMAVSGRWKVDKIIAAIITFKEFHKVETVADDIEIENPERWISGPKRVTHAQVMAIAKRHRMKLLTFDKRIPGKNVWLLE